MNLQKEIKLLERFIESIKEKLDLLQDKIDHKEEVFFDRSDKWQESEKGIKFNETIEHLQKTFILKSLYKWKKLNKFYVRLKNYKKK